jgi:hypothetical protein
MPKITQVATQKTAGSKKGQKIVRHKEGFLASWARQPKKAEILFLIWGLGLVIWYVINIIPKS